MHIGLHHHGEEGPVDPAPALEDAREKAARAQLGDFEVHVSGLGREQPVTGAVALGGPTARALEAFGADLGGRFGIDEGLEHQLHAPAHDVDVPAGADSIEQFVQVTIGDGHWVSPWLSLLVQPKITAVATSKWWTPGFYTTRGDVNAKPARHQIPSTLETHPLSQYLDQRR